MVSFDTIEENFQKILISEEEKEEIIIKRHNELVDELKIQNIKLFSSNEKLRDVNSNLENQIIQFETALKKSNEASDKAKLISYLSLGVSSLFSFISVLIGFFKK